MSTKGRLVFFFLHIACLSFCKAHDLLLLVYLKLGGGGSASGNEQLTQPSPAKPTWAQILNSNANAPSNNTSSSTSGNNNAGGHNSPSSSTASSTSQHSAPTKNISPSASGTLNSTGSRPGFMSNYYDQQQTQMNWPLNFNQTSPWMLSDDNTQRQASKSSQQSNDNAQSGGDGMVVYFAYYAFADSSKYFFIFFCRFSN